MNYEQLENELLAMGYGNCGNNGDWSVDAWCLSNGIPNRHNAGIYLLDSENNTYSVVQRFYDKCDRDGNDTIELLIEFDSIQECFEWMQVLQMFAQNKPYPMLPFYHHGSMITNPALDETGRFEVGPGYYDPTVVELTECCAARVAIPASITGNFCCTGCWKMEPRTQLIEKDLAVNFAAQIMEKRTKLYHMDSCDGCGSSAIAHTYQNQSFCVDCCNAAIQTGELGNCVKCGGYVNDQDVCCGIRFDGPHPYKDIDSIVEDCEFAFFAELVKHYPEITTGSFPPDASFEFRNACRDAIGTWLKCNRS